jgi:hypothetical protein
MKLSLVGSDFIKIKNEFLDSALFYTLVKAILLGGFYFP